MPPLGRRHFCLLNNIRHDQWNQETHGSCLNKEEDIEGQRSKARGKKVKFCLEIHTSLSTESNWGKKNKNGKGKKNAEVRLILDWRHTSGGWSWMNWADFRPSSTPSLALLEQYLGSFILPSEHEACGRSCCFKCFKAQVPCFWHLVKGG